MIGTTVQHYRIFEKLGGGGMGVVYAAEDTKLGRRVALKFLPEELSKNPQVIERFRREARAASSLNHPNICTIHDIQENDGRFFLVMELLDGETLRQRLSAKPLTLDALLDLGTQIADALSVAHQKGIVHRDIKPANIFITNLGTAKLLDFGLAKLSPNDESPAGPPGYTYGGVTEDALTTPGIAMGTVAYMSPEQARGEELDARTDLFSFGTVLYEMAAGRMAFPGSTTAIVFHAILERTPANPSSVRNDVPPRFDEIVSKALEKDRSLRYQSATEIGADLKRLKRDTDSTRTGSVSALTPTANRKTKRSAGLLAAGLSFAVILAIAILFGMRYFKPSTAISPAGKSPIVDSVAVLPFVNASGDPNTEYLSEGITQDLVHTLSQIPNLKVVSLMSVYRYKGKNVSPQTVAAELGVHTILNGRLAQQGDNISITAELVDADRDTQLWSNQYQRTLTDVSTLQSDITKDIAGRLKLETSGAAVGNANQRSVQMSAAYPLYLQGRFFWNRRTAANVNQAIDYFQKAIAKDPDYALAYSGLADSYFSLARNSAALSPKDAGIKARQAAEKAIDLDPSLAEAHASLALELMIFEWDFRNAEREFHRSIELNPNYPFGHQWYGEYLFCMGRYGQSVQEMLKAVELEPYTPNLRENYVLSLLLAKNFPEADMEVRKTLDMDPNYAISHYVYAQLLLAEGKFDEAVTEMEKTARLIPESAYYRAFLGYSYAKAGKTEEARKILGALIEESKTKYVSWIGIGGIYAGLGEFDHAYAALELAFQQGDIRMNALRVRADIFSPQGVDPRFAALLKRIGLPPLD